MSRCSQVSSDLDRWPYRPHVHTHKHTCTGISISMISFPDERKRFVPVYGDDRVPLIYCRKLLPYRLGQKFFYFTPNKMRSGVCTN